MSGAALPCCPVCGSRIKIDRDYMEHTLMEESWKCGRCGISHSEWSTGCGEDRIGFCYFYSSYTDCIETQQQTHLQFKDALEETRRLWNDPDYAQWKHVVDVRPEDDPTLYLVFADWLAEKCLILNEAGVRQLVANCTK